jgi:hypothetical protein
VRARRVPLQPGDVDPHVYVAADRPDGVGRLTYVTLDGETVTALVTVVGCEPVEGLPAYTVNYAVPPSLRRQGRARKALASALAELQHGFARNGVAAFYATALVDAGDAAGRRVAEHAFAVEPTPEPDPLSGRPALRYLRRFGG